MLLTCKVTEQLTERVSLQITFAFLRMSLHRRQSSQYGTLMQDALGRTALMFAAGSSAEAAVKVLLDAGASLAARDRRNKGILDYAGDDTPVRALLEER